SASDVLLGHGGGRGQAPFRCGGLPSLRAPKVYFRYVAPGSSVRTDVDGLYFPAILVLSAAIRCNLQRVLKPLCSQKRLSFH
ncbi:unnamed protein product, partial [Ixodes pacificus]